MNLKNGRRSASECFRQLGQWLPMVQRLGLQFACSWHFRRHQVEPVLRAAFELDDFSVFKTTAITERVAAQFRVEIFNLFNQLNLANPDGNIDDGAGFGLINATRASAAGAPGIGPGEPRNVQLALKVIW